MPFFEYIASDKTGKIKTGQMEGIDREAIASFLRDQDLLAISVKEKTFKILKGRSFFGGKLTPLDKINFTGNLSIMLKAGVNIPVALDVLSQDTENPYFRKVLADLKLSLENGKSLSESLDDFPGDFSDVFINLVKAGEASGKLVESLNELNLQLKKDYSLISKVRTALSYPAVLIGGIIAVVLLLMIFVLPRLVTIFESSSIKLPLPTRMLFFLTRIFSYRPVLTIVIIIALIIIGIFVLRTHKAKALINQALFHLPIASNLIKEIELVRFARTLGNLLKSGISIVDSLKITSGSLGLPAFKKVVLEAKEEITKGVSITNAFRKKEGLFPGLLLSIIQVGEKTGELDALLLEVADFYEEQVDNTLKNVSGLIEPILLVIVGLTIGGMALSIIMPIYQLIGSF